MKNVKEISLAGKKWQIKSTEQPSDNIHQWKIC